MSKRSTHRVIVLSRAERDLQEIWDYIQAESPVGARRVRDAIEECIDSLERMPRRFGPAIEAAYSKGDLRQVTVFNYRVVYQVVDRTVYVLIIRHAARLPADDLASPE